MVFLLSANSQTYEEHAVLSLTLCKRGASHRWRLRKSLPPTLFMSGDYSLCDTAYLEIPTSTAYLQLLDCYARCGLVPVYR